MYKIYKAARFIEAYKKFVKKNPQRAEALIKSLKRFRENPNHPGLHVEKLKAIKYWSMRVDLSNRIFFIKNKNDIILTDLGPHDKYKLLK